MNEVMNICWKSILCNFTVSNIVIVLVRSSTADGESFLVIFHVFLYLSEIILARHSIATKKLSQPTFNFI